MHGISGTGGVRVKRCGKSAPPREQSRGQGKPHTEQDQIGRNPAVGLSACHPERSVLCGAKDLGVPRDRPRCSRRMTCASGTHRLNGALKPTAGACRLGAPQPPGRSLEPRSNARPRGMTVPSQGGQNSAYRSGCHLFNNLRAMARKPCQILATIPNRMGRKHQRSSGES